MIGKLDFVSRRRLLTFYSACRFHHDYGPHGPAAGISQDLALVVLTHLDNCEVCRTFIADEAVQDLAEPLPNPTNRLESAAAEADAHECLREIAVNRLMGPSHILNQIRIAEQELAVVQGLTRKIQLFLDHLRDCLPKED